MRANRSKSPDVPQNELLAGKSCQSLAMDKNSSTQDIHFGGIRSILRLIRTDFEVSIRNVFQNASSRRFPSAGIAAVKQGRDILGNFRPCGSLSYLLHNEGQSVKRRCKW